jgi:hypothetical protein
MKNLAWPTKRMNTKVSLAAAACALGLVAVVSCGESNSGSGGNGNGNLNGPATTKDQFIAQVCAEYADCCAAAGRPTDGAQCRAFYGAFAPPNFDQAVANDCLAEIRALPDLCDSYSVETPSCEQVFSAGGTAMPGEECEDDDDCAPADEGSVECVTDFIEDATIQQCQVRLTGEEGSSPCVGTVDGNIIFSSGSDTGIPSMGYLCRLADGLTCDDVSGECRALAEVGEACSGGFYDCVAEAYCDFAEGMCTERIEVGEPCQTDDQCLASAYCDESDSTCAARNDVGESCSTNSQCISDQCTNEECAPEEDLALAFLCGSG